MCILRIIIEAIPREQMRYATDGDWFERGDDLMIQVPNDLPHDEQFLIALHELVEVKLCIMEGVSQQAVDEFDFAFTGDGEPGDSPYAPYRNQHRRAMLVEHMRASFMGLDSYGRVE